MYTEIIAEVHKITPEGLQLEGELVPEAVGDSEPDRLLIEKPLHFSLNVQLLGSQILVSGSASIDFTAVCDRCIKKYDLKVSVDEICHYIEDFKEDRVELTEFIREDVLLEVPMKLICNEACVGLCPTCGKDLIIGECKCSKQSDAPSIWDELDGLNL